MLPDFRLNPTTDIQIALLKELAEGPVPKACLESAVYSALINRGLAEYGRKGVVLITREGRNALEEKR